MKTHDFIFEHLSADLVCAECEAYADSRQRIADRRNRRDACEARFGIQPARTRP